MIKGYKMTLDLLEKSYIGHTVNSLRKAASNASPPNKDVATHARSKYQSDFRKKSLKPHRNSRYQNYRFD